MEQMATSFLQATQPRRYRNLMEESSSGVSKLVEEFLAKTQADFPTIKVDLNIVNPHHYGATLSKEYDTDYNSSTSWIRLNGTVSFPLRSRRLDHSHSKRVVDMMNTIENQREDFEIFQFMFAVTIIHEVGGHFFLNSLADRSQGRHLTPCTSPFQYKLPSPEAESGFALEKLMFKGIVIFRPDNNRGMRHKIAAKGGNINNYLPPGIPCLDYTDGSARKIFPISVKEFVEKGMRGATNQYTQMKLTQEC